MSTTKKRRISKSTASISKIEPTTSGKATKVDSNKTETDFEEHYDNDNFRRHFFNLLSDDQARSLRSLDIDSPKVETRSSDALGNATFETRLFDVLPPSSSQPLPYKQKLLKNCGELNSLQTELAKYIVSYCDVYYPNENAANRDAIRDLYCMHALNHILRTRQTVLAHNAKLKEMADANPGKPVIAPESYRDQGLTRPKVLILVPFRDRALKIVNFMIKLLFGSGDDEERQFVTNRKRFKSEFQPDPDEKDSKRADLPSDFKEIFTGNVDDCFRIGLGIARKSLKLFVDFYQADIIVASPLGLRTIIGAEGEKEYEYDFLSSIELLILDEADVFTMQNWSHVLHVMEHLHKTPKDSHDADFSRVHMWVLNEWSQFYRQTLLFSSVATPELRAIFTRFCRNYAGWLSVKPELTPNGVLGQISISLSQCFHRIPSTSPATQADERFDYFISKILPKYHDDNSLPHTLLFVPSYFDFVRIRNHFKRNSVSSVQCCEYTTNKKISRARAMFFHGEKLMLMLTERFHFFRRYKIRGVHHVIFFELPQYARFYAEICNLMALSTMEQPGLVITCTVLYTKFDALKLSAIVGPKQAAKLISSDKQIHVIVT